MTGRNDPCACGSGKKFKKCCASKAEELRLDGLILACPTRGQITTECVDAILSNCDGLYPRRVTAPRRAAAEARNTIWGELKNFSKTVNPKKWIVIWHDDDAWWAPGTFAKVLQILHGVPEADFLFARCCMRGPYEPSIGGHHHDGKLFRVEELKGEVVEITLGSGHFFGHWLSVVDKLPDAPFTQRVGRPGSATEEEIILTEDFSLCVNALESGCRLFCDKRLIVAHCDEKGLAYIPNEPAMAISGNTLVPVLDAPKVSAELRSYGRGFRVREGVRAAYLAAGVDPAAGP